MEGGPEPQRSAERSLLHAFLVSHLGPLSTRVGVSHLYNYEYVQ